MHDKRSVYLVGPMGSGKTAVGRRVARALGLAFYDSDSEIERRAGMDIPFIFEKEGESRFRQREREALDALTQLPSIVLATGGGAVLLPENRRNLTAHGTVVYLQTSVEQQASRVGTCRNRPLLLGAGNAAVQLDQLMDQRAALYEEVANVTVSTDGQHVYQVAEQVLRELTAMRPKA